MMIPWQKKKILRKNDCFVKMDKDFVKKMRKKGHNPFPTREIGQHGSNYRQSEL